MRSLKRKDGDEKQQVGLICAGQFWDSTRLPFPLHVRGHIEEAGESDDVKVGIVAVQVQLRKFNKFYGRDFSVTRQNRFFKL